MTLMRLLLPPSRGQGLRQGGDDHSGWGRGHRQQRIEHANGTHPSCEHKAGEDATEKSDIGDWSGHGRTPVTPSNRLPLANRRPNWLLKMRWRHPPALL